ncbi:pilus assembly protein PilP [Azoarcus indigens]|uniref:Type IV pilus assembly protein PilP n=1 Tax=Azoarcus indigens TaxID=29545 RepID=A0A4R6E1Z7_9RHOO|nr:pilus assembly protein PilP [Azoarcus indigens]NMG66529.1 pilus assembly protein PilP [Azoarcus indigens]TDN51284.1 type IV pilus assembly protein PilP [Azoarcus indigens]
MRGFWWVVVALSLAACSSDQEDIQAWMNEQAKTMRGAVKPLPEIKPADPVAYAAGAVAEPFRADRLDPERRTGGGVRPDMDRRREPLEAYPLESLRMVGVLTQGRSTQALVQADRNLYQVKVGNYMGQNFGVVTAISESEVTLRELVQDVNGDWVERTSSLLLQEQQGAGR